MTKLIVCSLLLFSFLGQAHAFDWKTLHEKADLESLEAAQAAAAGNPNSAQDLYVLGLVCLNLRKDLQAQEAFEKMVAMQPDDYAAAWGLAEVKRRQHDIEQSQKMLKEIIQKHPAFSPALVTLAYIKYSKMEFEQAVKLGYAVIRGGEKNVDLSNYTRAHLIIGGAKGMIAYYGGPLSKLINGTGILPMLKDAQGMQPDSPAVWFGLGSFYFMAPPIIGGDLGKGIEYLERVTQADPGFADAYVRLGQIYRIKGDNQKYEELLAKALQIDPKNELALDVQSGRCKFICTPAKNE